MDQFGFFPDQPVTPQDRVPRGYAVAGVRVGDLHETVICSRMTWDLDAYLAHWIGATRACLEAQEVGVFCTDLDRHVSAFIGHPVEGGYAFHEQIGIVRTDLVIAGTTMRLREPQSRPTGVSTWLVSLRAMGRFVGAGSLH